MLPVALERDIDEPGVPNSENVFYFAASITVKNCGNTALTGVEVEDLFSNEAQPFETDQPSSAAISPSPRLLRRLRPSQ